MNPRITSSALPFKLGTAQLIEDKDSPEMQPMIMTIPDSLGNNRVLIVDVCYN